MKYQILIKHDIIDSSQLISSSTTSVPQAIHTPQDDEDYEDD